MTRDEWNALDDDLYEALTRIAGAMELLESAGVRLRAERSRDGAMVTKCAADLYSMYCEVGKVHGRLDQVEVSDDQ